MKETVDKETSVLSESLSQYKAAREQVAYTLSWLRANLNHDQNEVLQHLLTAVETCTEMEWEGAFQTGFDMGLMCSQEDDEE